MPRIFTKDPSAVLDYYIDWTTELAGDTITLATWTSLDASVILSQTGIQGAVTRFWASGGTVGAAVGVRTHVTTAAGREMEQTQWLILREQ